MYLTIQQTTNQEFELTGVFSWSGKNSTLKMYVSFLGTNISYTPSLRMELSSCFWQSISSVQAFEELEALLAKYEICIAVKEKLVKDSGVAEENAYDNIVHRLLTKPRARGMSSSLATRLWSSVTVSFKGLRNLERTA